MRKSPIGSGRWVIFSVLKSLAEFAARRRPMSEFACRGADLPGWVEAPLYGFGNGGWPADTVA